jgi:hypothetical protein
LFSPNPGAGTTSLNSISGDISEPVTVTTIDSFIAKNRISAVTMLKVDTEGFDFQVLAGAASAISKGTIEAIQFEYNWRWLLNHSCLRDVFDLVKDKPYTLGKLTGNCIEFYDSWHFELDRFFEGNYVLIRNGSRLELIGSRFTFDTHNTASQSD